MRFQLLTEYSGNEGSTLYSKGNHLHMPEVPSASKINILGSFFEIGHQLLFYQFAHGMTARERHFSVIFAQL